MSQRPSYAIGTGLFIVLGFSALAYLATQTTSMVNTRQGASYTVDAHFANIGQLKARAPVKVAGVRIGQVQAINLDLGKASAEVKLSIERHYDQIPEDSVAVIYTSGLLGDQYVGLEYGHSKKMLADGGDLGLTRSAQQLEELIGRFMGAGDAADNIGGTYLVKGHFSNVGSIAVGSSVKMAGKVIGSVQSVQLDPVKLDAVLTLAIDQRYSHIPDDSSAAILSSGLIGPQFVAIQPGGAPESLKNGDEMVLTQSALQLEDLIGKFLVSGASGGDSGKKADATQPAGHRH